MNNVEERLATVESMMAAEHRRLSRFLVQSVVIYAILVVVVIAYTCFAAYEIKKMTSEDELLSQLRALMLQVPDKRRELVNLYDQNADPWAKQVVAEGLSQVDSLEEMATGAVDEAVDKLAEAVRSEILPTFTAALKEHAPEIKQQHADFKDPALAASVVEVFSEVVEAELDKYVNEHFVKGIQDLQVRLNKLASPKAKLTRKEDAMRQFLQCWVYLADHADMGESPLEGLLKSVKDRWLLDESDLGETGATLKKEIHEDIQGLPTPQELPKVKP